MPKDILQDRPHDISKLIEMLDAIDAYPAMKELSHVLDILGKCAGGGDGLRYNDKDAAHAQWIRNKYGRIRRHMQNAVNAEGIPFEQLVRLGHVVRVTPPILTEQQEHELRAALSALKRKLLMALKEEAAHLPEDRRDAIIAASLPEASDTAAFVNVARAAYHEGYARNRIRSELEFLQSSFTNTSSRDSRYVLGRVLVIIGELLHEEFEHQEKDTWPEYAKRINAFRDLLVHHHSPLINNNNRDPRWEHFNLQGMVSGLLTVINGGALSDECKKCFNTLEAIIKGKEEVQPAPPKPAAAPGKKPAKVVSDVEKLRISMAIARKQLHIMDAEFEQTSEADRSKPRSKYNRAAAQLVTANTTYQALLASVSDQEKRGFPPELSADYRVAIDRISDEINQRAQANDAANKQNAVSDKPQLSPRQRLAKTLTKVERELAYIREIENRQLADGIKERIIQHSAMVIGQYLTDLPASQVPNHPGTQTEDVTSRGSQTATEASRTARVLRVRGLAHDVLSFDASQFMMQMFNKVLPARQDFLAIHTLNKHDPKSAELNSMECVYSVGMALMRLGHFQAASEKFYEVLYAGSCDFNTVSPAHLKFVIACYDAYAHLGKWDDAGLLLRLYDTIFQRRGISGTPVLKNSAGFTEELAEYYKRYISFYLREDNVKLRHLAMADYEKGASRISDFHVYKLPDGFDMTPIHLNAAKYFEYNGKFEEAADEIQKVLNQTNQKPESLLFAYIQLIDLYIKQGHIEQASATLSTVRAMYESNESVLREQLGDMYALIPVVLFKLKVKLLPGLNKENKSALLDEWKGLLNGLPAPLQRVSGVGQVYGELLRYYVHVNTRNGQYMKHYTEIMKEVADNNLSIGNRKRELDLTFKLARTIKDPVLHNLAKACYAMMSDVLDPSDPFATSCCLYYRQYMALEGDDKELQDTAASCEQRAPMYMLNESESGISMEVKGSEQQVRLAKAQYETRDMLWERFTKAYQDYASKKKPGVDIVVNISSASCIRKDIDALAKRLNIDPREVDIEDGKADFTVTDAVHARYLEIAGEVQMKMNQSTGTIEFSTQKPKENAEADNPAPSTNILPCSATQSTAGNQMSRAQMLNRRT